MRSVNHRTLSAASPPCRGFHRRRMGASPPTPSAARGAPPPASVRAPARARGRTPRWCGGEER
uniref:Uncharacterized protein n=1 Tax=Arundo donax TaxID=35708 RepID=A0A0A9GVB2_ARUDO